MTITVEKNKHNGALILSAIHNGYLITKQYHFYSTRAAKVDFIQYLKNQ